MHFTKALAGASQSFKSSCLSAFFGGARVSSFGVLFSSFPVIFFSAFFVGKRTSSHSGHRNKSAIEFFTGESLTFFGHG